MKYLLLLAILTPTEIKESELVFNTMWGLESAYEDRGFDEATKTFYVRKTK